MTLIRRSLAAQFFAALSLTAVLVIATLGGLVALSMQGGFEKYLLQGELERMDKLVEALSESHDPLAPGWPELVDDPEALRSFLRANDFPHSPSGRPLSHEPEASRTGPLRPEPLRPPPPADDPFLIAQRLFLLDETGGELLAPLARPAISARRAIPAPNAPPETPPLGFIGLTAPRDGPSKTDQFFLRGQYRNLALASLLALALSALVATLLARYQLRPIKALEQGARSLANGDFETRIANDRKDELGQLIDHTNALAESLQTARDAERQWVSDTSHELQTPLAVLRAEVEAMQDGIRQADDKTLGEMHDSVMRLSRLVTDLKTLSLSREGQASVARAPMDVATLLQQRVEHAGHRLSQAGLALHHDIEEPLECTGDADRITQVFDNLLENALRYTLPPGEIVVTARREGAQAVVLFEDSAPAPPPEAMPHLFRRFYRAEASRSRALGGSGLGLSICAAIIAAHGGTIHADASPLGGLRIRLALPIQGSHNDPA